ncbi:MAG: hypothetical protein OXO53_12700 [Chloroflexota bacterium]|nr:hypothetical protein [Chloroflexota bacterium]
MLLLAACSAPAPTASSSPTPTPTPLPIATATPTLEPAATATPEPIPTPTATLTATPTPRPTATPEPTPTPTATPTATPTPKPTATPTPRPTPTPTATPTATPIPADPDVLACLLDHECSGLFRWEQVNKSAAARSRVYWVDDALPALTQSVIRTQVMPALAEWTHGEWVESEDAPEGVSGVKPPMPQLSWIDGSRGDRLCGGAAPARGCAEDDRVWLWESSATTGRAYPLEVLFEVAVHEALHALWEARHVSAGVTCEWPDCPVVSSVSVGGHSWDLKMRPLDAELFTLFGLPALENGMTLAEVASLFGMAVAVEPPPTPLPTPERQTDEEMAIAAGTRCSGLASLRAVVWEVYPRLDANGVLRLSGSIEEGAPSIKDARKSYSGIIHPAFTLYAREMGTNERGNYSSVGRVWPQEMASRVSGRGSPNAFADVYNVTRESFEVVVTLPPSLLAYEQLHITVWSSLVEELADPRGSTAGLGSCKVWQVG